MGSAEQRPEPETVDRGAGTRAEAECRGRVTRPVEDAWEWRDGKPVPYGIVMGEELFPPGRRACVRANLYWRSGKMPGVGAGVGAV